MRLNSWIALLQVFAAAQSSALQANALASAEGVLPEPNSAPKFSSFLKCMQTLLDQKLTFTPPTKTLSIPTIHYYSGFEGGSVQSVLLVGPQSPVEDQVQLVDWASVQMQRRTWSGDFLAKRSRIARKYANRSAYLATQRNFINFNRLGSQPRQEWGLASPERPTPPETLLPRAFTDQEIKDATVTQLEGSFGLTYSTATKTQLIDFPNHLGDHDLSKWSSLLLPEEEFLRVPVRRFFDSQGRSIALELRTYAKDPGANSQVSRVQFTNLVSLCFYVIRRYPELYDKPIFSTYNDALGVRFYKQYGFKVREDVTPMGHPIHLEDSDWYLLDVSPKDLELSLLKYSNLGTLQGLNQPVEIKLPNGLNAWAAPGTSLDLDSEKIASIVTLNEATEVAPGYTAAAGSQVIFGGPGHLVSYIQRLDKSAGPIPEGSEVRFETQADHSAFNSEKSGLHVTEVSTHGKRMWVDPPGIDVKGVVHFGNLGYIKDESLIEDYEVSPGLYAAKGSLAEWHQVNGSYKCSRIQLAKPYTDEEHGRLPAGSVVDLGWGSACQAPRPCILRVRRPAGD